VAKITEIRVNLGVSMEHNGKWYKPDLGFTIAIEGEEQKDEALRTVILERAFDLAEKALADELERLIE
jgi:hypothetical protein